MAEPDDGKVGPSERMRQLAKEYLFAKVRRDQAEDVMLLIKAEMIEEAGGVESFDPIVLGDQMMVYSTRSQSRAPNVVALQKHGVSIEEFSTVKPTMKALMEMAKRRKWGQEFLDQFIIDSGERVPSVSVRPVKNEESDDDGDRDV